MAGVNYREDRNGKNEKSPEMDDDHKVKYYHTRFKRQSASAISL